MAIYRCIGRGVTNSSGVATLNRSCDGTQSYSYGYKGQGRGLVNFVASAENPSAINSSSDVSQPYPVWDTKWYDLATDNTKESSWWIDTTNTSVSYDGDGRTITKTDNNTTWRYFYYNSNALSTTLIGNRYSIPTGNIIEFEVTAITGSIVPDIMDNLNNHYDGAILTSTGTYKIVLDGTDMKIYKDNGASPIATKTMNGSNVRFGFVFNAYNESITYKNFKVYSY